MPDILDAAQTQSNTDMQTDTPLPPVPPAEPEPLPPTTPPADDLVVPPAPEELKPEEPKEPEPPPPPQETVSEKPKKKLNAGILAAGLLLFLLLPLTVIFVQQQQEIRSRAAKKPSDCSKSKPWCPAIGVCALPNQCKAATPPKPAATTPKPASGGTTITAPTLVSIGSSYTSTECTARGGTRNAAGQCMVASASVPTPKVTQSPNPCAGQTKRCPSGQTAICSSGTLTCAASTSQQSSVCKGINCPSGEYCLPTFTAGAGTKPSCVSAASTTTGGGQSFVCNNITCPANQHCVPIFTAGAGTKPSCTADTVTLSTTADVSCNGDFCCECRLDASFNTCVSLNLCTLSGAPGTVNKDTNPCKAAGGQCYHPPSGNGANPPSGLCRDINMSEVIGGNGCGTGQVCCGGAVGTPPGGGDGGTTTTTTTAPQCVNIQVYKGGTLLTSSDLPNLKSGDTVTLTYGPGAAATKVQFRVNNGNWNETTTKNGSGAFIWDYTLSGTSFSIEAQYFDGSAWH